MNHFSLELYDLFGESRYQVTLSNDVLRFLGCGRYEGKLREEIQIDQTKIERFLDALRLLEMKEWKNEYICEFTDDGEAWKFEALIDDKEFQTSGRNAYPAFKDPKEESDERDRLDLLIQTIETVFYSKIPFKNLNKKPAEQGACHNAGKPAS